MKRLIFVLLLIMSALLLTACGSSGNAKEGIEINEDNLLSYFQWKEEKNVVTDENGDESTRVDHYLVLRDEYADSEESSSVVVRVIYELQVTENGKETQSWPITAVLGLPSQEPVYTGIYGSDSEVPENVQITSVEGSLLLKS